MRSWQDMPTSSRCSIRVALIWFDLSTGAVVTTHVGLRETLRHGLRDWTGRVMQTPDGQAFLLAVYDHFFLKGYRVHWFSARGAIGTPPPIVCRAKASLGQSATTNILIPAEDLSDSC